MPNIYNAAEYADIVFVYGYCNGSARAAVAEYARRFPLRRLPDKSVFSSTFQRLKDTGSTSLQSRADGIFAPFQNEVRTENILQHFDQMPSSSTIYEFLKIICFLTTHFRFFYYFLFLIKLLSKFVFYYLLLCFPKTACN